MIHVCIDTNILFRFLTQGRPGCEKGYFDGLQTLSDSGVVRVVLPEVVLLEIQKHFRSLPELLRKRLEEFKKSIPTKGIWNEIEDVANDTMAFIDNRRDSKISTCQQYYSQLQDWLKPDKISLVPLTPDILFNAKRRLIASEMPTAGGKSENDCIIVESLRAYFRAEGTDGNRLYFCTENCDDFAVELPTGDKNRTFVIHPMLQDGLPPTSVFSDMRTLMNFAEGHDTLPTPTPEEIKEAVKAYEARLTSEQEQRQLQRLLDRYASEDIERERLEYLLHRMDSLPVEIRAEREKLLDSIGTFLADCRRCRSWDERSELKLPQWLEHEPPFLLPFLSLPKLARVERNLREYLRIHQEADARDGVPWEKTQHPQEPEGGGQ